MVLFWLASGAGGSCNVASGDAGIDQWLEQTDTDAFLVTQDGKIVHEEYLHGMREDEPH
jgi:hypothetical protein